MSNSIEVRSPFLDYRIHEFAAQLPRNWLLDKKIGKKFLRDISKKYLPAKIQSGKKMGFGIPINLWTREAKFLSDLTEDARSSDLFNQYLDLDGFNNLKQAHQSSKMNAGWILWNIAMLLSWEKRNLKSKIHSEMI